MDLVMQLLHAVSQRIQSTKTFYKIVNFILHEADNIFQTHLEVSLPDSDKDTLLWLKNTRKNIRTYKAFIARSKFLEATNLSHIKFLADSLVELYSLYVLKSSRKALVSIQRLAKILRQCLHTKKKETMEKIYSWQYIDCVDLWVTYVSASVGDNDLQQLVYLIVQLIDGVAHLFDLKKSLDMEMELLSKEFQDLMSTIEKQQEGVAASLKTLEDQSYAWILAHSILVWVFLEAVKLKSS